MSKICVAPFFTAEIFGGGDVFLCCPSYTKLNSIGNIFEQSWEEIWNNKEAIRFREKIKNGDYSECNQNFCNPDFFPFCREVMYINPEKLDFENPKARIIKFSLDRSCNVACTICRDKLMCNNDAGRTEFLNSQIEKVFLPIVKDAEILNFCGTGDPFSSKHIRNFVKIAAEKYPHLKFDFHTNGILCDERNLTELGVLNRLSTIQISLHSATKETYDKIVKHGNWEKLNSNLEFLSKKIEDGTLNELHMNFVVLSENFRDIPAFIELCKKYKAKTFLWQYRDIEGVYDYDSVNVCSPLHRDHASFVKIINGIDTSDNDIFISPLLKKYTEIKDVEQYNLYATIFANQVAERYETGNSIFEKRIRKIEDKVANLTIELDELMQKQEALAKNTFLKNLFSVRNEKRNEIRHKIITVFGIKMKFKMKNK